MNSRRTLLLVVVVAAFAANSACSGGSGLSTEEYGAQLQELDDASEARQVELQTAYVEATADIPPDAALTPDVIASARTYYEGLVQVGKDFVNAADDLEPPNDVKSEHDDFIAAYDAVLVELNDIVDGLDAVATANDLIALTSDPDLTAAINEANTACAALQQASNDASVPLNLECRS